MNLEAVAGRPVSRETIARLELFAHAVVEENKLQNLVSPSTIGDFLERHIVDSLQLLRFIPPGSSVCDIGSGAGLPGLVIAATCEHRVTLVEPRKLRADFLRGTVEALGVDAEVKAIKAGALRGTFDVLTARAVAPLDRLVPMIWHLSHDSTLWVLPKGRTAHSELESLRRNWHCAVREAPSVTDPQARVLTLRNVKAKVGR